jgi:hypothetical protein
MQKINQDNNFSYLCLSLLALLFASAFLESFEHYWAEEIFSFFIFIMLLVSIKSLGTKIAWKRLVYSLLGLLFLVTVLGKFFANDYLPYFNLSILLLFFTASFWIAYKQILFEGEVDSNKMIGSLSLYLLLGLIWTVLYLFIFHLDPTAFSGLEAGRWRENFAEMAYYSFVTLTTLGYGDILPKSHIAQFFVYIEAIIGVFYMAIIVSSLISLRLASLEKKRK